MATPKNLNAEFPDYCSGCKQGVYMFDTEQDFFGYSEYRINCIHQEVCSRWAAEINAESRHKEVADG